MESINEDGKMTANLRKIRVYHGTLDSNANAIYKDGFIYSKEENEWLGHGVYFFSQYSNAKQWAITEKKKSKHRNKSEISVVICAILKASKDNFLDLDRCDDMSKLEREIDILFYSPEGKAHGLPEFLNDAEQRCFYCNYYRKIHPEIKIMAYTFCALKITKYGFPTNINSKQYCVTDNDTIELGIKEVV
jgi:hypothetical protein